MKLLFFPYLQQPRRWSLGTCLRNLISHFIVDIDGLVQERRNSIANALEYFLH